MGGREGGENAVEKEGEQLFVPCAGTEIIFYSSAHLNRLNTGDEDTNTVKSDISGVCYNLSGYLVRLGRGRKIGEKCEDKHRRI